MKKSTIVLKDLKYPILFLLLIFICFLLLAPNLSKEGYVDLQTDWFIPLNYFLNLIMPFNDIVWSNITYLGNTLVVFLFLSAVVFKRPQIWASILASIPLASIFSSMGKSLASMPRPASVLDHHSFVIIDKVITGHTSFPSGHSISISCLISVLVLSLRNEKNYKWIRFIGFSVITIVLLSRIAVGAHWLMDVLVGGTLGYIAALSGIVLANKFEHSFRWLKQAKDYYIFAIILLLFEYALLTDEKNFTSLNAIVLIAAGYGLFVITQLFKASWEARKI